LCNCNQVRVATYALVVLPKFAMWQLEWDSNLARHRTYHWATTPQGTRHWPI